MIKEKVFLRAYKQRSCLSSNIKDGCDGKKKRIDQVKKERFNERNNAGLEILKYGLQRQYRGI